MKKKTVKKFIASLAAAAILVSGLGSAGEVRADNKETSTQIADDDVSDATPAEMEDVNGRISFWEWTRLTNDNATTLLNDNEFHAAMFVKPNVNYGNGTVTFNKGFLSFYGDGEHLFYATANTSTALPKLKDITDASLYQDFHKAYDEYTAMLMKEDSDGKLLNDHQEYFSMDKFYTNGGPMGCFFIRKRSIEKDKDSKTKSGHDLNINGHKGSSGYHGPCLEVDIDMAVCRASCKNDPDDMSYLDIGTGQDSNLDYFLDATLSTRDGQENECRLDFQHDPDKVKNRFHLSVFRHDPGYKLWVLNTNELDGDYRNFVSKYGWATMVEVEDTETVDGDDSNFYNTFDRFTTEFENFFEVYIGKQYVFSSLKGEKNPNSKTAMNETTGAGGILTVSDGTVLSVADTYYQDKNGKTARADGCVIPETSTVKVESGGVFAIEGNLLNNGKIVVDGGTLIIRNGGTISPYGNTGEGTIECTNGGSIIVMPGGSLYTFPQMNDGNPDLILTNGSALVVYGLWVNYFTQVDSSSKIEVRATDTSHGVVYAAAYRSDTGYMYYKNRPDESGNWNVTNITKSTSEVSTIYAGIRGMYAVTETKPDSTVVITETTDNGMVILDQDAEFHHENNGSDYTKYVEIKRLTY